MKYCDHKLGESVESVVKSFTDHPGEMDMRPFGFDVAQGFEFCVSNSGRIEKLDRGALIPLSHYEEDQVWENLSNGFVELYLRRPSIGIPPYPVTKKKLLHAATGAALIKQA